MREEYIHINYCNFFINGKLILNLKVNSLEFQLLPYPPLNRIHKGTAHDMSYSSSCMKTPIWIWQPQKLAKKLFNVASQN